MISQEELMKIKILKEQGYSQRKIATTLGLSRNTVKRYLREQLSTPEYKTRKAIASKLDLFKEYLKKRLAKAKPIHLSAVVLLREIQEQEYTGGITLLAHLSI